MIQIESKNKRAKLVAEKPVMSQTQQEGQKKIKDKLQKKKGKDPKADETDQDLILH